ncbi:MAG: FecR family protein, partial [Planctomycetota bacterium]
MNRVPNASEHLSAADAAIVGRFLDAESAPGDAAALDRLLREPGRAAELRALILLEEELLAGGRTGGGAATADAALARIDADRTRRIADAVERRLSKTVAGRPARRSRRLRGALPIAVAAVLLCGVFLQLSGGPSAKSRPRLVTADGSRSLGPDEWATAADAGDGWELRYADGTVITVAGPARLLARSSAQGGKELTVRYGLLSADVAPQPAGRPLRIVTPTATLEVLGTTLDVAAGADGTRLDVNSGTVAITRIADGRRAEVAAGQFATAVADPAGAELRPAPQPRVPDRWALDLSDGLPDGWDAGFLIDTPAGPAVRSRSDGKGRERNVAVMTHNAWAAGDTAFARLFPDSVLTLTLRQDEPAPLRVMLVTRARPGGEASFGRQLYYDLPADPAAGTGWRTLRIPLGRP